MILLIDNYDSFTYNLYQYLGELEPDICVVRNDQVNAQAVRGIAPEAMVISPGPGYPADAGNCVEIVRELSGEVPILGVCLGHQAICQAFGAQVVHAQQLMHGKSSRIDLDTECPLFRGLPGRVQVGRYHSLAVDLRTLPQCLQVAATAPDGEVMAVQHVQHPTYGVQFHPESILTPAGKAMLGNFLRDAEAGRGRVARASG